MNWSMKTQFMPIAWLLFSPLSVALFFSAQRGHATPVNEPIQEARQALESKDFKKAQLILEPLVSQGQAEAEFMLGFIFEAQENDDQSLEMARRLYQSASEKGMMEAQIHLGRMLETGRGGVKNSHEAVRLYSLAANQGSDIARFRLKQLLLMNLSYQ
ncbi:MAG: tetratricopeptide repeat protein [Bdellovibrionia bacterium]